MEGMEKKRKEELKGKKEKVKWTGGGEKEGEGKGEEKGGGVEKGEGVWM